MNPAMRKQMLDELFERYGQTFGNQAPAGGFAFLKARLAAVTLHENLEEIRKRDDLNEIGRLRAIRSATEAGAARYFAEAHLSYVENLEAIRQKRQETATPKIDRSNIADLLLRQEIRQVLRSMPEAERITFIFADDGTLALSAVLEAPAVMSGLSPQMIAEAQRHMIAKTKPEELKLLEREEEGMTLAATALSVAAEAVREALELKTDEQWREWLNSTIGQGSIAEPLESGWVGAKAA